MITRDDAPVIDGLDETNARPTKLLDALSSSGNDRRRAHTEVLRRARPGFSMADQWLDLLKDNDQNDPAWVHLPWLVAATGKQEAADILTLVARKHQRVEVRQQAIRALIEYPALKAPRQLFIDALADPADSVKLTALSWFFDASGSPPLEPVARLAASTDPYLRQTAATLLARRIAVVSLEELAKRNDAPTRLAAALAAGIRLTVPPADAPPPEGVRLHYPTGSAFFRRQLQFADKKEPVDLADLGPVGSYTTAQRWAAVKPNEEETKLFNLLVTALDDPSSPVKAQAAYYLGLLRDPRSEPGVERVTRELRGAGLAELAPIAVRALWLAGPFADGKVGDAAEHPPQRGPIDLAVEYGNEKISWRKSESAEGQYAWKADANASTFAYFRVQSRSRQPALLSATSAGQIRVWHNGRPVTLAANAGPILLDLQPGSNDLLIRAPGDGPLTLALRSKERVTPEAPEKGDGALLAERLKSGGAKIGPEFLDVDWKARARTGDDERGRKLFGTLGCAKCHAITPDQAGGGAPSLADVGRRFTPEHLVESILLPDKQVAAEFRSTALTLANGQKLTGLVVRETAAEVELLLPDTTRRTVKVADIDERAVSAASPMPSGLVRTPAELRDLLTYLLSDPPAPP